MLSELRDLRAGRFAGRAPAAEAAVEPVTEADPFAILHQAQAALIEHREAHGALRFELIELQEHRRELLVQQRVDEALQLDPEIRRLEAHFESLSSAEPRLISAVATAQQALAREQWRALQPEIAAVQQKINAAAFDLTGALEELQRLEGRGRAIGVFDGMTQRFPHWRAVNGYLLELWAAEHKRALAQSAA